MRTRWAGQHLSDTDSTATGYFSPQLPQVVRRACRASALAHETWQPQTLAEAANALVALDHASACSYWHGVARARLRRTERRLSVDQCSPLAGPPSSKTIVLFYFLENPET